MWFLLAAFAGLLVYSTTRKGAARGEHGRRYDRIEAGYVRRRHNSPPPGPLMVLSELMSRGIYPPPFVVMCALAEAQKLGRLDIANDIVMTLIAPVVHQYDMQYARDVALGPQVPGGPMDPNQGHPQVIYAGPGEPPRGQPDPTWHMAPGAMPYTGPANSVDERDEMQARLNAEAERMALNFMQDLAHGAPPGPGVIDVNPATVVERAEPNTDQHGADQEHGVRGGTGAVISGAVDMTKLESPIDGVNGLDWSRFCDLLVRTDASPTFTSARHVGQYRQNKDRLAEIGIRPESLVGRPDLQREALDRDLADAHRHLRASGMLRHVGRTITLPGRCDPAKITLSGLLGLIQAAGFEGSVGWLEHYGDRKRFKHTTQAFTRTNGVF